MMTNDMADLEKVAQYIAEGRALGIDVLPPEVNESGVYFEPARAEGNRGAATAPRRAIRFGLAAIKGVGEMAVQQILEARNQAGPFTSLFDLCVRVDSRAVNRKVLEALIRCGACDGFGETRATLLAGIDRALAHAASLAVDRQRGQRSLFGEIAGSDATRETTLAKLPEIDRHERLSCEKELLGIYITGHPLEPYSGLLSKYALSTTATLTQVPNRALTRIGGMVAGVQKGISKKNGKPYALVTVEDLEGSVQVLCMNENYEKYQSFLEINRTLLIIGEVNLSDDKPKVFPQEILPLDDAPRRFTRQVHLRLRTEQLTPAALERAHRLVSSFAGRIPLFLCLRRPDGETVFIEAHERCGVRPCRELQEAVDDAFGPQTYYASVDTTLPERTLRRWEKKTNGHEDTPSAGSS
jgi:DNA polymerase-3 subunit alpha